MFSAAISCTTILCELVNAHDDARGEHLVHFIVKIGLLF